MATPTKIRGIYFLSIPADLIAASSRTASVLDIFLRWASDAKRKKMAERDMTHKKNLPKGENPSPEYPPLDRLPPLATFLVALLHPPLQFCA
eukprot:CAMPEP_0203681030 /NCGR_PEP_ID=MMETSP0090-20130426/41527_1 /ASSEMBLY_ACC=CAM_ASM_001088 /TAXON_ID=426623 /ORGANISM="Chaetoceros affinis, Strain CCMP159" /LENGTH=91 /DNA_ID=CAMNT_0050549365 /DNA_START=80 /DNA_END=355 /DNA_ORIENTATION=+